MNNRRISFHLYGSYHLGNSKGITGSVLGTGVKNKYLFLAVSHSITGEHQGTGTMVLPEKVSPTSCLWLVWCEPRLFSLSQASYDHVGKVKRIPGYLAIKP